MEKQFFWDLEEYTDKYRRLHESRNHGAKSALFTILSAWHAPGM
jgi:hypothetical protein